MSVAEDQMTLADAYAVLGVSQEASKDDIRAAWRRRTFEHHPDRNGGDSTEFVRIRAAYDVLQGVVEPARPADATVAPRRVRPAMSSRITEISPTTRDLCEELLSSDDDAPAGNSGAVAETSDSEASGRDRHRANAHVPSALRQHGRKLTYIVRAPIAEGINTVAVPTGELHDRRKIMPKLVTLDAASAGDGSFEVPEDVRQTHFPGARSVRIQFAG
ncbi:MAG: DnaJ domain-containing protein [Pseudomonadota bacterium]